MLYPYRDLTITSKVQECCKREFAAKLGEFDCSIKISEIQKYFCSYVNFQMRKRREILEVGIKI